MKVITTIVLLFISYSNALVTGPKKSGTKVIKKAPVKKVPAKKAPVKNAPVGDKVSGRSRFENCSFIGRILLPP